MNFAPYAFAGAVSFLTTIAMNVASPRQPAPVYTVAAAAVASIPADGMVDFGDARVRDIMAWTDGHGAVVVFDKVRCLYGVTGDHIPDNSLLSLGAVAHIRGHLYHKTKVLPTESFDCEIVESSDQ